LPSSVAGVADFRQALAFFERPTLGADRRALADRLSAVQEERHLEEEVERLRRKTRPHEEDKPPAEKPPLALRKRRSLRKPALAAAIVLGVGAGGAVAIFTTPAAVEGETAQRTEVKSTTVEKGFIEKLRAAAEAAFGSSEAPATNVASSEKASPAAPRPTPRRRTIGTIPSTPGPSVSAAAYAPSVSLADLRLAPPTRALPWTPPDLMLPLDLESVFTGHDSDVVPPVLMRPHLPRVESMGLPSDQLGTVEVVVGEDGRVDQVRLVRTTAERRYYDAMILAAVKAWVFRPAIRSGRPVRYRLGIPLT
jgi:TonB family protein